MADIKETKELVVAIGSLVGGIMKALKDGKVDLLDIPILFEILTNIRVGMEGITEVPAELKDLDSKEAAELGQIVLTTILGNLGRK